MKNIKNTIASYLLEGILAEKLAIVPKQLIPMRNAMLNAQESLENTLTSEQQTLFNKYHDSVMEYRDAFEQHYFSEGFKAGILFKKEIERST